MIISAPASAQTLTATYFGTSTLAFSDGETTLMIDGFLSRPGPISVLLTRIRPDRKQIDLALARGRVGPLCGVFVAHAHYDHALDSATVAARNPETLLFGSASVMRIAEAERFPPNRTRLIGPGGGTFSCGNFEVTAIPAPHGPDPRFTGEIAPDFKTPAHIRSYRLGDSYAFVIRHPRGTSVVHPSAGVRPGMYKGYLADTLFLGVGELSKQSQAEIDTYWKETAGTLKPSRIVPIHWDNFTRSLEGPLRPMPPPGDDTPASIAAVRSRAKPPVVVQMPSAFETLPLDAASRD